MPKQQLSTLDCNDYEESLAFVIITMIILCVVFLFGLAQSIITIPVLNNIVSTSSSSNLTQSFQLISWIGLFLFPVALIWVLSVGIQRCIQINKECDQNKKESS